MPQTVEDAARKVFGEGTKLDHAQRFLTLGCEVAQNPKILEVARSYADLFMFCAPVGDSQLVRAHLEGVLIAALMSGVQLGVEMEKPG